MKFLAGVELMLLILILILILPEQLAESCRCSQPLNYYEYHDDLMTEILIDLDSWCQPVHMPSNSNCRDQMRT